MGISGTMPYAYFGNFAITSGITSTAVIRLNSLFDPDQTGVGHQPRGYDQWKLFYLNYVVSRCDYEIVFSVTDKAMQFACLSEGNASTGTISVGTPLECSELPNSQYGVQAVGGPPLKFSGSVSIPKIMGSRDSERNWLDNPDNWTSTGSNATHGAYLYIPAQPVDATSTTQAYCSAKFVYHYEMNGTEAVGTS